MRLPGLVNDERPKGSGRVAQIGSNIEHQSIASTLTRIFVLFLMPL